jgi:hypothetical protein
MRTRTVTNTDPAAHRDVETRRILILGGGFAGAYTALHLERRLVGVPDVEIVLAARENFVLFTPMLHEVAGSDVAVTDVVQPLRKMLHRTRVLIVEIESIDLAGKRVRILHPDLAQAFDLNYDQLVLAIGKGSEFLSHARHRKTRRGSIANFGRRRLIRWIDANHAGQSIQRRSLLGRGDPFGRAVVPAISAGLRAGGGDACRAGPRGGCQLRLAVGPGLCARTQ